MEMFAMACVLFIVSNINVQNMLCIQNGFQMK